MLSLAARSWDIGSTMNPPQIRMVVYSYDDAIGGIATITGNNWNILNLDLSGWPYKNEITKIEISSRIKGHFTFNWQQNFHIDTLCFTSPRAAGDNGDQGDISELAPLAVSAQMRDGAQKLPVSYFTRPETEELLNDFDRGTGGWVGTENVATPLVSTKYSIANGQQLVGLPSVSGNMLEAEALPVLGSDWKRIQRRFATPLNVTKTPVFNFGARSWGGFVTPFVGRVLFISGANTCLGEFTYSADGWTYPAIDLSGWQYKNAIDAIEISFSATAVASPWNYKTQFDEMGFTTSGGTTAAPDTRFEGMAESLAKKLSLLDGLGILTGDAEGNFALEQNLTRREFAAIITRMLAATAQGTPPFSDVAADDWAAGCINFVYENQIMTGYGDGTFRPDNEVTVQEVFKTLLAVLGYGPVMEAFAPTPRAPFWRRRRQSFPLV